MQGRTWGCAGDTEIDTYETIQQGICSALTPSTIYATIDRSVSAMSMFQPADHANTFVECTLSRSKIREWLDAAKEYAGDGDEYIVVMGETLYRRLKDEFESRIEYRVGSTEAKQGFDSMFLDDIEIVKDKRLDHQTITDTRLLLPSGAAGGLMGATQQGSAASACDGSNVVAVLNMSTWSMRYVNDPVPSAGALEGGDKMMSFSDFVFQAEQEGGKFKYLARAWCFTNLCCDQPNLNLIRMNVQ